MLSEARQAGAAVFFDPGPRQATCTFLLKSGPTDRMLHGHTGLCITQVWAGAKTQMVFSTAVEHCSSAWQLLYANVAGRAGQGAVRHCSTQCHAGLPSSRVSIIAASFGQLCMSCGEECPHMWAPRVTLLYEEQHLTRPQQPALPVTQSAMLAGAGPCWRGHDVQRWMQSWTSLMLY